MKQHKKNIIQKISKIKLKKRNIFIVVIGILGCLVLLKINAATFSIGVEGENGNISGGAIKNYQSDASGGSYLSFNAPTTPDKTTFTLVSIPDTQVEVQSTSAYPRFTNRVQWLINNKDTQNIKHVMQVGDLQDWDDDTHSHYERASNGLKPLDQAGIPYALTVGNHDTSAVCYGGSACPGIDVPTAFRNIPTWNLYYPKSRFAGLTTLCDEFNQLNTRLMAIGPSGTGLHTPTYVRNQCSQSNTTSSAYRTFNAGGYKWLVMNYEMWPRLVVQEWMKSVIERHPDYNVILVTHMHLSGGNTNLSTDYGGYGAPQGSPKAVFDNVIKQYSNIKMTFSGHTGGSGCAVFTGVNGNKIYSYLNNRLGSNPAPNHVRLIKVDTAAKTATSQEYVPQNNTYLNVADNASSNCSQTNINFAK